MIREEKRDFIPGIDSRGTRRDHTARHPSLPAGTKGCFRCPGGSLWREVFGYLTDLRIEGIEVALPQHEGQGSVRRVHDGELDPWPGRHDEQVHIRGAGLFE